MAMLQTAPKLGMLAPDFLLPATDGRTYALTDLAGKNGTVVAFICNHCPYVKAVVGRMVADAKTLEPLRVLRGRVVLLVAAWVGRTRLIDNLLVDVP